MTRQGGTKIKSGEELAAIREAGGYLEYWQARLTPGEEPTVVDGFILAQRGENLDPAVQATASYDDGRWSVTFSRNMREAAPYKDIVPGRIYTLGFSVHAGHTAKRFHYVSFERTLAIDDGDADFVAMRQ